MKYQSIAHFRLIHPTYSKREKINRADVSVEEGSISFICRLFFITSCYLLSSVFMFIARKSPRKKIRHVTSKWSFDECRVLFILWFSIEIFDGL